MVKNKVPDIAPNFIGNNFKLSTSNNTVENVNPHNGSIICKITSSNSNDVNETYVIARKVFDVWSELSP